MVRFVLPLSFPTYLPPWATYFLCLSSLTYCVDPMALFTSRRTINPGAAAGLSLGVGGSFHSQAYLLFSTVSSPLDTLVVNPWKVPNLQNETEPN